MKENTKYNDYRFVGKFDINEIQPWFDFASNKPWDESEIPWVLENKVRREILIKLSENPKSFEELCKKINFTPKPLLVEKSEYKCNVNYIWAKKTVENHLLNLEWNNLIRKSGEKYEITFPIFKMQSIEKMEKYITKFAENWLNIIKESKDEINNEIDNFKNDPKNHAILIERAIEKLYEILKKEKILPQEPNIRILWAEQLRDSKFEEWLKNNF